MTGRAITPADQSARGAGRMLSTQSAGAPDRVVAGAILRQA